MSGCLEPTMSVSARAARARFGTYRKRYPPQKENERKKPPRWMALKITYSHVKLSSTWRSSPSQSRKRHFLLNLLATFPVKPFTVCAISIRGFLCHERSLDFFIRETLVDLPVHGGVLEPR